MLGCCQTMSKSTKVKRKKLSFNTKTKAMNMLGIPKTHFFESKPLAEVRSAFVKNLVAKKHDDVDEDGQTLILLR